MQGGSVLGLIAQDCVSNTDRTNHLDQDQHEPNLRSVLYYRGLTDTRNQIRLDQHAHGAESATALSPLRRGAMPIFHVGRRPKVVQFPLPVFRSE
jgi:hypothetical protein